MSWHVGGEGGGRRLDPAAAVVSGAPHESREGGVRRGWAAMVSWAGCWPMSAGPGKMENGPGPRSTLPFSYLLKKFPKELN
jgi:hypothetical protein